ncbi:MAG: glycosyltransferase [Prevotella sp.]
MPKLLVINISINRGSTGKIAEQIGNKAQNYGWDCYVGYGNINLGTQMQPYHIGGKWNRKMHALESRLFDNQGLASRSVTKRFVDYIKQVQPDIIHIHNLHGYYINYRLLFDFLKSYGKPVVWTLHDCWSFTGHCSHFVTANCDRWKTVCHDCPLRGEYPASIIIDRSKKNYEQKKKAFNGLQNLMIVPVSQWLGDLVKESFLKGNKIQVIHNGIDLSVFRPCASKMNDGRFRVISVSSVWTTDKGLMDFKRLRELLPEEFEITLVGLKSDQLGLLPKGVTGITRTDSVEKLAELYSQSDVLVNATYADTFPTVNLEALACGTPVITYNTGGSPEAIDEKTGIVVEQGNVEQLAEAIIRMRKNPLSPKDCRERAERLFDKDKCFEEYMKLFNQLLTKHDIATVM